MTVAQERAWQTLWPRYGREFDGSIIDLDLWFGRHARRVLEIGFGNGENLLALAALYPGHDFLGIEVHRPGVGHLLLQCAELGLTNVRVLCHDAMECLGAQLPAHAFAEVLLYFPDPWPKKRHHKRRIVQPAFVVDAARMLEPGGVLRLATDCASSAFAAESARERVRRTGIAVGRAAVLALVLGGWAFASGRLVDAEFLSDPRAVGAAFADLVASGRLFPHLGQTLLEVLSGYAIGVVLGMGLTVLVAAVEAAHRVLRPFLIAFYSIPKIALAPLIVMWFGLATAPKIILAATFVFFVVFMNMVAGVYAVNPHQANALRVMGADRRALLTKLILPGTVPYLMTGLRLAVPEALIGAVVGEFIAANRGLGYLVTSAAAQFNTTGTMAAILALLLIVAVMDLALTLAERRLLRWRPRPAASVVRG